MKSSIPISIVAVMMFSMYYGALLRQSAVFIERKGLDP